MNPIDIGLAPVRRLMSRGTVGTTCFVCHERIKPSDARIRLRGDTFVHRRCATYRMRSHERPPSRLGFPG